MTAASPRQPPKELGVVRTVGSLHHMSLSVSSADVAATMYSAAFGWHRLLDELMTGQALAATAALLDIHDLESAHVIIMHEPGNPIGPIEFVELRTRRGEVPTGLLALCYRVRDLDSVMSEMDRSGFERVCEPQAMNPGGSTPLRVVTYRGPHPGLIELTQFGRRSPR
jgi:catechol 2,3-dioxygenase-like lactoylglutathione lyase family enzyme